jgi:hypothetical protein
MPCRCGDTPEDVGQYLNSSWMLPLKELHLRPDGSGEFASIEKRLVPFRPDQVADSLILLQVDEKVPGLRLDRHEKLRRDFGILTPTGMFLFV